MNISANLDKIHIQILHFKVQKIVAYSLWMIGSLWSLPEDELRCLQKCLALTQDSLAL
jgi:hypothetical protein